MNYNYVIKSRVVQKITLFYENVAKKYVHTYSYENMRKNIVEAYEKIYTIERSLPRCKPTLDRWKGLYMAHADSWYYAYKIDGDTIVIIEPATPTTCTTEELSHIYSITKSNNDGKTN